MSRRTRLITLLLPLCVIAKPDGSQMIDTERRGGFADAEALGRDAGQELLRRGGPGFLST